MRGLTSQRLLLFLLFRAPELLDLSLAVSASTAWSPVDPKFVYDQVTVFCHRLPPVATHAPHKQILMPKHCLMPLATACLSSYHCPFASTAWSPVDPKFVYDQVTAPPRPMPLKFPPVPDVTRYRLPFTLTLPVCLNRPLTRSLSMTRSAAACATALANPCLRRHLSPLPLLSPADPTLAPAPHPNPFRSLLPSSLTPLSPSTSGFWACACAAWSAGTGPRSPSPPAPNTARSPSPFPHCFPLFLTPPPSLSPQPLSSVDIWALGVCMCRLVSGHWPPFSEPAGPKHREISVFLSRIHFPSPLPPFISPSISGRSVSACAA
jgi:hypothetical protein